MKTEFKTKKAAHQAAQEAANRTGVPFHVLIILGVRHPFHITRGEPLSPGCATFRPYRKP